MYPRVFWICTESNPTSPSGTIIPEGLAWIAFDPLEERKMTVEYYVKDTKTHQVLLTCETSEEAVAKKMQLNRPNLAVFYSPDALAQYIEQGERRFGRG